jgi:hypothetical protein
MHIQGFPRGENASIVIVACYDLAGQEHDGQVDAMLAQLSQYLYAGRLWQVPIEHGKVGIDRGGERAKQRRAIGESVNDKALAQQLDGQDLAIVLVTFDENDAAKLGLADGGRLCRSGRREQLVLLIHRQYSRQSV